MKIDGVDIKRCQTTILLKNYKMYLVMIPAYFLFGAFMAFGFIISLVVPMEEGMWIVPLVELGGALVCVKVATSFIKKAKCIKTELDSRRITNEEKEVAKNSFNNLIKISVGIIVAAIIITLIAVSSAVGGSSGTGGGDECRNCGRRTKLVAGYGYCYDCYDGFSDWQDRYYD